MQTFTTTDAASGAEILRPMPLNRVCLHIGTYHVFGAEGMAADLATLNVGEGLTFCDPFSETRAYVRRES